MRCIPLTVYKEREHLRRDGIEVGSADLLIYDDQYGDLIVADLTVAPPPTDKLQRLRNTASDLSERLGLPVRAVLIAPIDPEFFLQNTNLRPLAFVDKNQLDSLWNLIREGNVEAALNYFRTWLNHAP